MADDADDVFRRFGYGDPRWMKTPDDLRDPSLHPLSVNQFKLPPAPVAEVRNHRGPDAYVDAGVRDWATPGSVLAGAYELGRTIGTGYEDLRMGDYANAAKALPEIAMAMAPMPGPKVGPKIKAYHGTPHDFNVFSMDKIGTGEGAQAFGHGLYFAENPKVAEIYRKRLSDTSSNPFAEYTVRTPAGGEVTFNPRQSNKEQLAEGIAPEFAHAVNLIYWDSPAKAKAYTKEWLKEAKEGRGVYPDRGVDYYQRLYDYVRQIKKSDIERKVGRTYEVGLHADPSDFVDLNAKLQEQPREFQALVREALTREGFLRPGEEGPIQTKRAMDAFKMNYGGMGSTPIEAVLSERGGLLGKTAEDVSKTLGDAGIPGSRYLDAGSRSRKSGTRNYVVWTPEIIEVLKKYGLAGPVAGLTTADILRQYYGDDHE
jgi:hypothetical protein